MSDARSLLAALVEAYDRQTGNPKASLALRAVMVNARTYLASPPPEPETYTTDGRPYNGPPLASPPLDGLRHSWDATCDTPPDDDPYCHCARTFDATAPAPAIDVERLALAMMQVGDIHGVIDKGDATREVAAAVAAAYAQEKP